MHRAARFFEVFFGQLRTLGRRGAQIGSRQRAGFGKAGEILPPRLDEVGHEHRQHKARHFRSAQRVAADGGEYLFIAHAERLFRHRRARGGVQKLGVGQFPFVGKAGGEAALLFLRQALGRVVQKAGHARRRRVQTVDAGEALARIAHAEGVAEAVSGERLFERFLCFHLGHAHQIEPFFANVRGHFTIHQAAQIAAQAALSDYAWSEDSRVLFYLVSNRDADDAADYPVRLMRYSTVDGRTTDLGALASNSIFPGRTQDLILLMYYQDRDGLFYPITYQLSLTDLTDHAQDELVPTLE